MSLKKFVVIGGDAAGMSAASMVRRKAPDIEVVAYEMGRFTSYGACGMPYYVEGLVPELNDLVVVTPKDFEEKRGIKVHIRHRVEKIDPGRKQITVLNLDNGERQDVAFDELMIATGAEPVVPQGLDADLPGVFTLRGLPEAEAIKAYTQNRPCREALIIGAGYIGLEMAEALKVNGLEVTLLQRSDRALGTFENEVSEAVAEELARHKVRVMAGAEVSTIDPQKSGRLKAILRDGRTIETDLVVIGVGVRPRSELAENAGLNLGVKKAIAVDRRGRTSSDHIWSAGDCAEAFHRLLQKNAYIPLALTANRAGRIVGGNIAGQDEEFPGILGSAVIKVLDLTVARTGLGLKEARDIGLDAVKVAVTSRSRPHYYPGSAPLTSVLVVEQGTRRLWGAQMFGHDGVAHRINTFAAALAAQMTIDQIFDLDLAYAPPFSPVWDPVINACEIAMKKVRN